MVRSSWLLSFFCHAGSQQERDIVIVLPASETLVIVVELWAWKGGGRSSEGQLENSFVHNKKYIDLVMVVLFYFFNRLNLSVRI